MVSGGLEKSQIVQNGHRRPHVSHMTTYGAVEVSQRGLEMSHMFTGGSRWSQNGAADVIPSGSEQFQVVKIGARWCLGGTRQSWVVSAYHKEVVPGNLHHVYVVHGGPRCYLIVQDGTKVPSGCS